MNAAGPERELFAQGGEMGALMQRTDWSRTRLGPVAQWPRSLRTMLGVVLGSRFPMLLWWGPELLHLYNDAYRPILRDKHPASLAAPAAEVWAEVWNIAGPMARGVMAGGPATWTEDLQLFVQNGGIAEETYFTFSYSPVPGDDGGVGGILNTVQETTAKVQGERQIRLLRDLAARPARAQTESEAYALAEEVLAGDALDLPFVRICHLDAADPAQARWPLREALGLPDGLVVENLDPAHPDVGYAILLPLQRGPGEPCRSVLVAGLSQHRRLDERYRAFFRACADQLATVTAQARAYEAERQRALALAEMDHAKTAFFSNISHEFRTPLTLILGQLETARHAGLDANGIELLQRNALRLLGMVNNLLDFTRIESGRLQPQLEATDLSTLTRELASAFHSLLAEAGLRLILDCQALPQAIQVDRGQWEKIVFNLMSNAFKFTLKGEIEVGMRWLDGQAVLSVRDTGTGIPAEELPRLFERFHRVPNAQGRSHEGSGIGLALVHELVRLHGGRIEVESQMGVGSRFSIHLPPGEAATPSAWVGRPAQLQVLSEAASWQPQVGDGAGPAPSGEGRVLVVDDNPDLREFLCRMLSAHWQVETAVDGQDGLARALAHPPDLVLSDVMTPVLDGFGLLRALRADPRTRTTPVILLSARAGEEAVLEGLEVGADDYLVKPFTSQELLARVRSHLTMAKARNALNQELARLNGELESFNYTVAHDLRAPLRTIDGFGALLAEELGDSLSEDAGHFLERMRSASRRMSLMIDDLLMLARLGRQEIRHCAVDLSLIAEQVLEALQQQEPERELELELQAGLQVHGDPGLLRLALDNLLGNAWKYSSRQPRARIAFGAQSVQGETIYCVSDNGAGFDMRQADKLFGVFQRLHSAAEFPGTGIGLATVQRIVQRHGGRIWAESAPDEGARFYFTLGG